MTKEERNEYYRQYRKNNKSKINKKYYEKNKDKIRYLEDTYEKLISSNGKEFDVCV